MAGSTLGGGAAPEDLAEGSLDAGTLTRMILAAVSRLQQSAPELSELDRAIGDGDHGTTISRAAERIRVRLTDPDAPRSVDGVLQVVGSVFLDIDGGATGPLFGTFFSGMANSATGLKTVDDATLETLFEHGLAAVQRLTKAVPGDKTLMDALVPAVDAITAVARAGGTMQAQLEAAASAAEAGATATRALRARHGRARHLGERVIGHEDPGARSIAILLRGLALSITPTITEED